MFDSKGQRLGSVYNFMVDKITGQVAYAVMSFGGFLGLGERFYPLPWKSLSYDPARGGYVVDLDKDRLEVGAQLRGGRAALVRSGLWQEHSRPLRLRQRAVRSAMRAAFSVLLLAVGLCGAASAQSADAPLSLAASQTDPVPDTDVGTTNGSLSDKLSKTERGHPSAGHRRSRHAEASAGDRDACP